MLSAAPARPGLYQGLGSPLRSPTPACSSQAPRRRQVLWEGSGRWSVHGTPPPDVPCAARGRRDPPPPRLLKGVVSAAGPESRAAVLGEGGAGQGGGRSLPALVPPGKGCREALGRCAPRRETASPSAPRLLAPQSPAQAAER